MLISAAVPGSLRAHLLCRCGVLLLSLCGTALADRVSAYVDAAATTLPPQAQDALPEIKGTPAQLLALRGYLRADKALLDRWSWTSQQIATFEQSAQHRQLLAAIDEVNQRFQASNPGYSLFANTQVRSLDLQLARWNNNQGVQRAAGRLYESTQRELSRDGYKDAPDAVTTQRFIAYLRAQPPAIPVPLAVPGLSMHGQSRAIDFQIRQGEKTIAGPEIASVVAVWEHQGWAAKLASAVDTSRGVFAGPLRAPNEPWHYEYVQ
jgi:hypothetical protein